MCKWIALTALSFCLAVEAQTQPTAGTVKFGPNWRLLIGSWVGEGPAGSGSGNCSFRFDLGDHVIVRTNHAELPASGARAAGAHDDFMVISPGAPGDQGRAMYWDNEDHVIEYSASWAPDGTTLTFISKAGPGPQFRLTYKKVDADSLTVSFEIAPPGQSSAFKLYTSGRIRRAGR
jgi:hypothetical protein